MPKYLLLCVAFAVSGCDRIDVAGQQKNVSRPVAATRLTLGVYDPPERVRLWYYNGDGSCVQLSIGICGVRMNQPNAAMLPWDTIYGAAERKGATPSRVAAYCQKRGIRCYNVTGSSTWQWMRYAALTGRSAAIGFDYRHFQTLMDYHAASETWYVCDNRNPREVNGYSDDEFRRLHLASGQWCVVLYGHAPPLKVSRVLSH